MAMNAMGRPGPMGQGAGMQAGGGQGGGQGGGHGGQGGDGHGAHPPQIDDIDTWVDEVVSAGGIALPDGAETFMDRVADRLEAEVAEGTAGLGGYERHLNTVVRDLERIAEYGDRERPAHGDGAAEDDGEATNDTALSLAIHKIDEFLEYEGDNLSDEVVTRLQAAQTQLETVFADAVLSDDEKADVAAAAETVQGVLDGDFAKLSEAGLADLTEMAADARTLADTGFLALDDEQLAIFVQAQTDIEALGEDAEGSWAVHEIVDDLRFEIGGHFLALAGNVPGSGAEHAASGPSEMDYMIV